MTIDKPRKDPKRGFEVGLNLVKFLGLNEQQIEVFEDEIEGSDDFKDDMLHVVVALAIVVVLCGSLSLQMLCAKCFCG